MPDIEDYLEAVEEREEANQFMEGYRFRAREDRWSLIEGILLGATLVSIVFIMALWISH